MKALTRLYRSGMTRAQVAQAIRSTSQSVGQYERFDRFPSAAKFKAMLQLADSRGLVLLAHDFIDPDDEGGPDKTEQSNIVAHKEKS